MTVCATFLAEYSKVVALLRCIRPEASEVGIIELDAGMRPAQPKPVFRRTLVRSLRKLVPWSPASRILRRASDHVEVEYPVWLWQIEQRSDLDEVQIFVKASWRGRPVRLTQWADDSPGGQRVGVHIDNHGLPKQRELALFNERMARPPNLLLRAVREEWEAFVRPLTAAGWAAETVREFSASGIVPVEELELTAGPLPEAYSAWLRE